MNEEIQKTALIFSRYGAMVTKAQAARIMKKTPTRIKQMIKEGKIQAIQCAKVHMIPFSDIIKLEEVTSSFPNGLAPQRPPEN